ncbi:unnamed protein product [Microthlaspi erraticum]|uniref:Uncharacterized protein n=1 Tax=Microthlaspi erraticum TaxID=1685480 RepID=A0A6D2HWP8_9BRAS|nr:unnamed protein product [Microthlaspi erraticum]
MLINFGTSRARRKLISLSMVLEPFGYRLGYSTTGIFHRLNFDGESDFLSHLFTVFTRFVRFLIGSCDCVSCIVHELRWSGSINSVECFEGGGGACSSSNFPQEHFR